jgi:hypothetical protein
MASRQQDDDDIPDELEQHEHELVFRLRDQGFPLDFIFAFVAAGRTPDPNQWWPTE